ncbi:anillin-like [Protopterus annectens]|uniref:anillin-like n=1 Tax=Protopterus annectens TaxID=7888 RepID=UPI001CFB75AC|nr:anillin-like [Protopterus annectens]
MDPFTEKLLERTRARRENLQKKMAERPTAATKTLMQPKRTREPLLEAINQPLQPVEEKKDTNPSPSKRRCSGNKDTSAGCTENKQPGGVPDTTVAAPELLRESPAARTTSATLAYSLPSSNGEEHCTNVGVAASSVKSRMQKLVEQRRYWDNGKVILHSFLLLGMN